MMGGPRPYPSTREEMAEYAVGASLEQLRDHVTALRQLGARFERDWPRSREIEADVRMFERVIELRSTWPADWVTTWGRLVAEGLEPDEAKTAAEGIHHQG